MVVVFKLINPLT